MQRRTWRSTWRRRDGSGSIDLIDLLYGSGLSGTSPHEVRHGTDVDWDDRAALVDAVDPCRRLRQVIQQLRTVGQLSAHEVKVLELLGGVRGTGPMTASAVARRRGTSRAAVFGTLQRIKRKLLRAGISGRRGLPEVEP